MEKQINNLKKIMKGVVYEVRTTNFSMNWRTKGYIYIVSKKPVVIHNLLNKVPELFEPIQDFNLDKNTWLVKKTIDSYLKKRIERILKQKQKEVVVLTKSLSRIR
jgi:hypothetical protein